MRCSTSCSCTTWGWRGLFYRSETYAAGLSTSSAHSVPSPRPPPRPSSIPRSYCSCGWTSTARNSWSTTSADEAAKQHLAAAGGAELEMGAGAQGPPAEESGSAARAGAQVSEQGGGLEAGGESHSAWQSPKKDRLLYSLCTLFYKSLCCLAKEVMFVLGPRWP
jgi:hypothetical protein